MYLGGSIPSPCTINSIALVGQLAELADFKIRRVGSSPIGALNIGKGEGDSNPSPSDICYKRFGGKIMRTNLIMHFHCSECGRQLDIVSKSEETTKTIEGSDWNQQPKEPTGADCFYTPKIQIEPCRNCIEKYTKPALKIAEGLKEFNSL